MRYPLGVGTSARYLGYEMDFCSWVAGVLVGLVGPVCLSAGTAGSGNPVLRLGRYLVLSCPVLSRSTPGAACSLLLLCFHSYLIPLLLNPVRQSGTTSRLLTSVAPNKNVGCRIGCFGRGRV